jgi:hypothetical protein
MRPVRHKHLLQGAEPDIFDETKVGYQHLLSDLVSMDGQIPLPKSEIPFSPEFLAEIDSSELGDPEMPSLDPELEPHDRNLTPNDIPHSSPTQVSNHNLTPGRTNSLHQRQTIPAHSPTSLPTRRYSISQRAPSTRLKDFWTLVSEIMEEPLDYSEANQHEDWKLAIKSEMDSIIKNQTWEIIDRPPGKNPRGVHYSQILETM